MNNLNSKKTRVIIDKFTPKKKFQELKMKNLKDGLYFIPMGGVNEIGMNLNLLLSKKGDSETLIIVDAGTSVINQYGINSVLPTLDKIDLTRVSAIVCTHGHMDHIGAIPFIIDQCPNAKVYATLFTKHLVQGMINRNCISAKGKFFNNYEIVKCNESFTIGDFEITLVHITHSIPESNFIFIRSYNFNYTIAHSGDWKLDKSPGIGGPTDLKVIEHYANKFKVDVLLCDSTNSMEPESAPSESVVKKQLAKTIKENVMVDRSILISCFASNVDRVTAIIEIVDKLGLKACFLGKSMDRMYDAAYSTKVISQKHKNLIKYNEISQYPREKVVIICTGSQGEEGSALTRMVEGTHKFKVKINDIVIFSSSLIPGNEKSINNLKNNFLEAGVGVIDDPMVSLHASGHPGQPDIRKIIEVVNPKFFIPVHGDRMHLLMNCKLTKTHYLVPFNGAIIRLNNPKKPSIVGIIPTDKQGVDGNQLINVSQSNIIKHRDVLSKNGIVSISKNEHGLQILHYGFIENEEKRQSQLKTLVKSAISDVESKEVNYNVRTHIAFKIKKEFGKEPMVIYHNNKKIRHYKEN